MAESDIAQRSEIAIAAVLPSSVRIRRGRQDGHSVDLELNGEPLRVTWLRDGGLRQVRELIGIWNSRPDVVVARVMSLAAREALSDAGIGWVDETGAAEIARGALIVSRDGRAPKSPRKPSGWTPAVLAIAEALLCGGRGTVDDMRKITALSAGSATNALRILTDLGFLHAEARRGPNAARRIVDPDRLLDAYAAAAAALTSRISITVGVTWRDPAAGLADIGRRWDRAGISWAATGVVAGLVLAPYLTTVAAGEVYVDGKTVARLEWVAAQAGLRPIEGGRLTLRPFPTVTAERLTAVKNRLRLVPWPRAYADLRIVGVRGEEAAEHLRETMRD